MVDLISFVAFCILDFGGLGFRMAAKVKLFSLEQDGDEPRSMGKINSKEDESYALLRSAWRNLVPFLGRLNFGMPRKKSGLEFFWRV